MNVNVKPTAPALLRAGLVTGALVASLLNATAFADDGQVHNPANLPAVAQAHANPGTPGNPGNPGTPNGQDGQPGQDGPGGQPEHHGHGQDGQNSPQANQSAQSAQSDHEDQGSHGEASLARRHAFSGIVGTKASGQSFKLVMDLGGDSYTITVLVDEDTALRGRDDVDLDPAKKPVDAFFALLNDLIDTSGADVRANVRGELTETNGKPQIVAVQVSLHAVPDTDEA